MPHPVSAQTAQRTVLLQGHVIDSLTLSKVIDLVQAQGGDYELNDIRIGGLKKDISSVNLTLSAASEGQLNDILEAVQPYGAQAVEAASADAELVAVQADGQLPEGALDVKHPEKVKINGQWVVVTSPANHLAIKVAGGQAELTLAAALRAGDQVVAGGQGVLWS